MTDERYPDVEGLVEKLGAADKRVCPFDRPNTLEPSDPCPVCGDRGDDADAPVNCIATTQAILHREAAAFLRTLQARLSKAQGERDHWLEWGQRQAGERDAESAKVWPKTMKIAELTVAIQALQSEAAALRVERDELKAELKHIVGALRMMKQGASDQDLFSLAKLVEDRQLLKDPSNG